MAAKLHSSDHVAIARAKDRITGMITAGTPLHTTLTELVRVVESTSPAGVLASILLLDEDGRHLRHGAAPSLPEPYTEAIDGEAIGPEAGSCGTAAFHNKTVIVYDIANDPLWANYRDVALKYRLRACWSTPIQGSDGRVLGTFANYYPVVRDPSPVDRELTEMVTRTAAKAIEHHRKLRV